MSFNILIVLEVPWKKIRMVGHFWPFLGHFIAKKAIFRSLVDKNGHNFHFWAKMPFGFWKSSSQYYDCLSLTSTQVTGMRLFDKTVEMAAIFLHYVPKMAKMRFSRPFLTVKCHLPFSFWDSSSQYYDCLSLASTQVTGMRLFVKNVEIVAFFVHKRPKNGLFLL